MADPSEALRALSPPGAGRVAIAVPDGTRSLPVARALEALCGWLGPDRQVQVVVGLGLHRPMTAGELAPLRSACPWPVHNHDPDTATDLGPVEGFPCQVHPLLAAADHVVTVGLVELHQYAGFSGGHKGVAVGCGGRSTLAALHTRELVCHPDVVVGRLEGNPFRDAVDALGRRIGCTWALQGLPDGRWVAGTPEGALTRAANALEVWEEVRRPADRCLLRVPRSKGVNLYQASRAATYLALSPRPPLLEGARLVLDAPCPEGAGTGSGERAFAELLRSSRPPWQDLLVGEVPRGAGLQRAFMFARLAQRYHLVVAGCERPEVLRALGIDATSQPADEVAGPGALEIRTPFERLPQLSGDRVLGDD